MRQRLRLRLHFGQLTFNRTRACFPSNHFRNSFVHTHTKAHVIYIYRLCAAVMGTQSISFNYKSEENQKCLTVVQVVMIRV